jgi:hypothetical protein
MLYKMSELGFTLSTEPWEAQRLELDADDEYMTSFAHTPFHHVIDHEILLASDHKPWTVETGVSTAISRKCISGVNVR